MILKYRCRHYLTPVDGTGGTGGGAPQQGNSGNTGNTGFLQSAMNLFSRPSNPKAPNAVIDPTKYKFDPETGKPIVREGDPSTTPQDQSTKDPLDNFKGLFDTASSAAPDVAPSFKLDPEKLKTLVGSLDFTTHLTPELQEKLKGGDPEAMQEALNGLGRSSYARLMEHIPALTEAYVNARLAHDQKGLGRSVKSTMTKQSLDKLAADNPVLKRQLDTIGDQLLGQFPNASPEWIAEQVPQYFVSIAKMLAPDEFKGVKEATAVTDAQKAPGGPDFDWGSWMSGQSQAANK